MGNGLMPQPVADQRRARVGVQSRFELFELFELFDRQ
jgi:hypothetical protein